MKFKLWLENQEPTVLYHNSRKENRQSILQNGLKTEYDQTMELGQEGVSGSIYLSNKPTPSRNSDTWEVNTQGLEVEEDWTTQPEDEDEMWYVTYQDIPPNRLKLL